MENEQNAVVEYRVPTSVTEMKPPKKSSLIGEMTAFQRAHWEEVKDFFAMLSGEIPSAHGAADLDEAACIFEIQRIAKANGFAYLGTVPAAQLRTASRFAFKRNTGVPVKQLKKQRRQLQLEHKRQAAE
jgi:hypothetical protein